MKGSAVISADGKYRYVLRRSLGSVLRWYRPMLFVMLNPSTADAEKDDPTIRRCIAFAKREGMTHLTVVNLFALRATDPKELTEHADPVGPENDHYLIEELRKHRQTAVAAWGAHDIPGHRFTKLMPFLPMLCLGRTKDGSPRHPLYVKSDAPLIDWKGWDRP